MATNSKLQLTGLDFDSIKQNLQTYLQSQSEFSDYDFQGSALNILLDVLAYNTFYNAYYMNMVANEMFLDSAVLRQSIISHAKLIGYTPRSAICSQTYLNVTITRGISDSTTSLRLPRFTQFSAQGQNGTAYSYYTVDDTPTIQNTGSTFAFTNVLVKEGLPVTKSFQYVAATNPNASFELTDENIDISTLIVTVQTSTTNPSFQLFTLAQDATQVSTTSNVYYIEESRNGGYTVYFGDGVLGAALVDGNVVKFSYLTTNADAANGCKTFSLQSQILPLSVGSAVLANINAPTSGGAPIETISSIKFSAPKSFISQNRAVTVNDYVNLVNQKYPYFNAVNVWGGEQASPPVYGVVYISAVPKNGFTVTQAQQQYLLNDVLKPISVLTVTPQYVPADYNFLNFNINVTYDPNKTTYTPNSLQTAIGKSVSNFANTNLNTFNSSFYYSKFLSAIDSTDTSIYASEAKIYLQKKFIPDLQNSTSYTLTFGVPLHRGTLNDRLYSSPAFNLNDISGASQLSYIEEIPFSYGGIDGVQIVNPGNGYTVSPTLTINGDGVGANAYAVIVNGQIGKVIVDKPGDQYTTATITIGGGGATGSGAVLTPILLGSVGTLRTYYFDANGTKKVLNNNAGTIYYSNGTIQLVNFGPSAVGSVDGSLSIYAQPEDSTFAASHNIVLAYNNGDSSALSINLTTV
jgi:hypothetical protein